MKVLLVEGQPGEGAAAEARLRAAGHEVVGCGAIEPWAPCRGLQTMSDCPLDAGDVDVAVVSRTDGDMAVSERGALCAARRRIPVVVDGPAQLAVSFGPVTHIAGGDLLASCTAAARSGSAHAAAVRRELLMSGVVTATDVETKAVAFEVDREHGRLRLTIRIAPDDPRSASIRKSAAEALRRFDQWTPVIDVVVQPAS